VPLRLSPMLSSARRVCTRSTPLILSALLACVVALLLCGATSAFAKSPHSASCATASERAAHGERACAAHHSRAHKRHEAKRHHAKHHKAKQGAKSQHGAPTSVVPAQEPAICEDGASPTRTADGSYACGDGAEPECTNGSEPIVAPRRGQLLCPAASSGVEWSEATCQDGSTPTQTDGASYLCGDGSAPECEDGSKPVAPDEGSPPACLEVVSKGSSGLGTPEREQPEEEAEAESSAEDAVNSPSVRSATTS
jgi:hypothetical protein